MESSLLAEAGTAGNLTLSRTGALCDQPWSRSRILRQGLRALPRSALGEPSREPLIIEIPELPIPDRLLRQVGTIFKSKQPYSGYPPLPFRRL
jgi:hypothetical protein